MSNLSVVLSVLAHLPSVTEAHGYMGVPLSRNAFEYGCRGDKCKRNGEENDPMSSIWLKGTDTDTTCGNAFEGVYEKTPWDEWEVLTTIPESTFTVELYITNNHGGNHHLNFVCMDGRPKGTLPSSIPISEWEWLTRASSDRNDSSFQRDYPFEFFVPVKLPNSGRFIPDPTFTSGKRTHTQPKLKAISRWNSPSKPCNHGILRWSWETSNSCISDKFQRRPGQPRMTGERHQQFSTADPKVCTVSETDPSYMERYINCADVKVAGQNGGRQAQNLRRRALEADVAEDELLSIPTYARQGALEADVAEDELLSIPTYARQAE